MNCTAKKKSNLLLYATYYKINLIVGKNKFKILKLNVVKKLNHTNECQSMPLRLSGGSLGWMWLSCALEVVS